MLRKTSASRPATSQKKPAVFLTTSQKKPAVFLTHAWGLDKENRDNHARVKALNDELKASGIDTWFDEAQMTTPISQAMSRGIDAVDVVIVCITRAYIEKCDKDDNDNCKDEFHFALKRKSPKCVFALVMEPDVADQKTWNGPVGLKMNEHLYISFQDDSELKTAVEKLRTEIFKVTLMSKAEFYKPNNLRKSSMGRKASVTKLRKATPPRPPMSPKEARKLSALGECPLLQQKLADPDLQLNQQQSMELLTFCMRMGVRVAPKAAGKDAIVVIGNTGAGKSTFCNFLAGCDMQTEKRDGVKVITVAQDSPLAAVMKIGHSTKSETFTPNIQSVDDKTFIDCPGFLDNRGWEINISNAVNIRVAVCSAASARVVVLINYASLLADRSRGLLDLLKICIDLFGSEEHFKRNLASVCVGISQYGPMDRDGDPMKLDDLKAFFVRGSPVGSLVQLLAERIFIFHPLGNGKAENGFSSRQDCINRIGSLPRITSPQSLFKTVLIDSDELKLHEITAAIGGTMQRHLLEKDFQKAARCHRSLQQLQAIDHATVGHLLRKSLSRVQLYFQTQTQHFNIYLTYEEFEQAMTILAEVTRALKEFGPMEGVGVDEDLLTAQYNAAKKKSEVHAKWQAEQERMLQDTKDQAETYKQLLEESEERYKQDKLEWEQQYENDKKQQQQDMQAQQDRMAAQIQQMKEDLQARTNEQAQLEQNSKTMGKLAYGYSYLSGGEKKKKQRQEFLQMEQARINQEIQEAELEKRQQEQDQQKAVELMKTKFEDKIDEMQRKLDDLVAQKQAASVKAEEEAKAKAEEEKARKQEEEAKAKAEEERVRKGLYDGTKEASTQKEAMVNDRPGLFPITLTKPRQKGSIHAEKQLWSTYESQRHTVPEGYISAGQEVVYLPSRHDAEAWKPGMSVWLEVPAPANTLQQLELWGWHEQHNSVEGDTGYSWTNTYNDQEPAVRIRPTRKAARSAAAAAAAAAADKALFGLFTTRFWFGFD